MLELSDHYVIWEILGEGSSGQVYRAVHKGTGTEVALKVLRVRGVEAIQRFKREFRAVQNITHRNLVQMRELSLTREGWVLCMEIVDGDSFLEYVWPTEDSRGGSEANLDLGRLRSALLQLARGLQSLHASERVHRDLKPMNVRVTQEHRLVILDFGIVGGKTPSLHSTTTSVVGTPAYLAPEQVMGAPADMPADLYAAGVMVYEALTGRLPFEGSVINILMDKTHRPCLLPREVLRNADPEFSELCEWLTRLDPKDRPTAAEIVELLEGPASQGSLLPAIFERDAPEWRAEDGSADTLLLDTDVLASGAAETSDPRERKGARLSIPVDLWPPPAVPQRVDMPEHGQALVGRQTELDEICHGLHMAQGGGRVALRVRGEPGVGKSLLLREAGPVLQQADAGLFVALARCRDNERIPFNAIDEIIPRLARFLATLPDDQRDGLLRDLGSDLAGTFPVLTAALDCEGGSEEAFLEDHQQPVAFERGIAALCELIVRVTEDRAMVWLIDDIQWADADSLTLLRRLFEEAAPEGFLLIASTLSLAPSPPHVEENLKALWAASQDGGLDITLGPLPRPTASSLALRWLRPSDQHLADQFAEDAGGHPLFLRALAEASTVDGAATLRTLVAAWLDAMPSAPRQLMELSCAVDHPLSDTTLAEAARLSPTTAARHLYTMCKKGLLRRQVGTDGQFVLVPYHPRLGELVREQMSPDALREARVLIDAVRPR